MTQHGVRAIRQNRGHEDTTPFEPPMADRVHASMHAMQPSPRQSTLDGTRVEPEVDQLPQSDHSVLPRGQFCDFPVTWM
jgi:hypothetical protein